MNAVVQVARHHWWVLLVLGILALLFGIIALADPLIVLLAFIYVFAVYAILDGITTIAVSLQERSSLRAWWVLLLEGIIGIIFGILVLVWPVRTALVLLYLVAIWALVRGVLEISSAFVVPRSAKQRWGMGLAGLLSHLRPDFDHSSWSRAAERSVAGWDLRHHVRVGPDHLFLPGSITGVGSHSPDCALICAS